MQAAEVLKTAAWSCSIWHLTKACRRRLPASARPSLPPPAAADAERSGSSRQGCTSERVKVPIPAMARCRRLAYPGREEGTNHERLGRRNHDCPTVENVAGGATGVVSTPAGLNAR